MRPAAAATLVLAAVMLSGLTATAARAAVPAQEITSSGPLTSVTVGNELSCQVAYRGDMGFELYPPRVKPGDCGTLVFTAGTLYAPSFAQHDSTASSGIGPFTAFTPVNQSAVSGAGTESEPLEVTTVADAGTSAVRITEINSYIVGQESYRTETIVSNVGDAPAEGILYRAGDCYLQESDVGFGFVDAAAGAVGCSINANNTPAARIEQWYPITRGNQYMQARFTEVWEHIATHTPFPDTARTTESLDNGAGISWNFAVSPGGSATYAHYTTFSPRGVAGPPQTPPTAPSAAFGSNGLLDTPSNRACVSRRYFRIRVRQKYWPIIVGVTIKMPKTTRILRRPPWGTIVDLRGLPRGTFSVKITALTTTGKTIKGTRRYRTCRGTLRGGKPPL